MATSNVLQKAGIKTMSKLPTSEVNNIADIMSKQICKYFPEYGINQSDLFNTLQNTSMYYATFTDNSAAKYSYVTGALYFRRGIDFNNPDSSIMHECIHYMQTVKNANNKLVRLGLYKPNFTGSFGTGMALNEAAVQLMASEMVEAKDDVEKYYDMDITTNSPNYYPIQCALVKQMAYFTGTYPLYHSALYSDDIFKNTFIMKSSTSAYNTIVASLDRITNFENSLQKELLYLPYAEYIGGNKLDRCTKSIKNLRASIKDTTLKTQELILTSCMQSELNLVRTKKDIQPFKDKIYNFSNITIQATNYSFYNDFYCQMMEELNSRRELIEKFGVINQIDTVKQDLALIEIRQKRLNLFKVSLQNLKELFHINQENKITASQDNKN